MPIGRPRAFDIDHALDCAVRVFWRKGYEGASLRDLTKAMGINRPSLYAAFGDKESLFRRVIEHYVEHTAPHVKEAMNETSSRQVVERLLQGTIDLTTNPKNPRGCFIVQGALACGDAANSVRQEMIARRHQLEITLRNRLERSVMEGDLPVDVNPTDLARYVAAISHGIAVQAAGGATRRQLKPIVRIVLDAWPGVCSPDAQSVRAKVQHGKD